MNEASERSLPIDIIVPVYRGFSETRRCIESVLAAPVRADFELVVIEDKSPEVELVEYLGSLSERGLITLLKNTENLGFVSTVNRGMQLHLERDVLLLNSDTEVANDWLDRIHAAAYSAEEIGTITPFSNNATICSYPYFNGAGNANLPSGLTLAELDGLVSKANADQTAEIPTAVGFCMFIKRACLNEVGYFDAKRFGRGYGEENDFSRNAALLGWRNVLAADVYVFHAGGVSFGTEQSVLQKSALATLLDKHPDYLYTVDAFVRVNPLRIYRSGIDTARGTLNANQALLVQQEQALESSANPTAQIKVSGGVRLHIAHSWGGGIERWVDDFVTVDTQPNFILQSETDPNAAGAALSLWMAWAGKKTKIALWHLATPIRATEIHHPEYAAILRDLVDKLAVQSLFVSSLIGHALDVFALRLPTIVILHDVYPFCPAFFAHYAGAACTRCDVNSLRTCQQDNPMYYFWHDTRPEWWVAFRGEYAMVIAAPWVQLVAPTHVAWARWQQLLPAIANLPCTIIGHGIDVLPRTLNSSLASGQRLRVVIPGRLVEHKGLSLVAELLPKLMNFADVFLLGCGGKGWAFVDMPQVKIVFDYPRGELADKIAEFRPDCALLLSIVPETFSYTLSEMQALGVPVVATNLGAYRERIEHDVTGWLVEPNVESILNLLRVLDAQRAQIQTVMQYWQMHLPTSIRTMLRQYLTLLPSSVVSARHSGFVDGVAQRVQQLQQDVWVLDEAGQHQKQEFEVALASAEHRASLAEHHLSVQTTLSAELFESQQRLLGSRSWRLTVPIRWLGSQVRVLRNRLSSRHDHAQSVGLPSPVVVALTGSASEDSSVPIQGAPDISSTSRRYDVSRAELCTLSGLPLATIWLGLDDPSPADLYPFTLIEFIKASCKHSNAIRFFMSDAAFEQVRHSEVGAAIYQLLTQRVIIRTPAEWDKLGRQFSGDCMVIFSNLKQQMASAACALLRSGCFLILWNDNQADILLPESAQIGRVMDSDWQEAALQLMAWLATDFVERQAIAKQSQTLPLCNDC